LAGSQFEWGQSLLAGPAGEQVLGAQLGTLRVRRGGAGSGVAGGALRGTGPGKLMSADAAARRVARKADHRPHFTLAVAAPHGRSPVGIHSGVGSREGSRDQASPGATAPKLVWCLEMGECPPCVGPNYHDGGFAARPTATGQRRWPRFPPNRWRNRWIITWGRVNGGAGDAVLGGCGWIGGLGVRGWLEGHAGFWGYELIAVGRAGDGANECLGSAGASAETGRRRIVGAVEDTCGNKGGAPSLGHWSNEQHEETLPKIDRNSVFEKGLPSDLSKSEK
jgi:hypothetical protein